MIGIPTALLGGGSGSRQRAYEAARRHSGHVRILKVAIPLGAALAGGLVAMAALFDPLGRFAGLTLGPISVSGSKIAMENPRLTGFRKDSRPYEVTAKAAYQDIRRPGTIELSEMRGKLALDGNGGSAELASSTGVFDSAKELLDLKGDVRITTSRREEVLLKSASVDFKAGTVVSREPVKITTSAGIVEAEGVQVSDNGHVVSFTGRVRTQFRQSLGEPSSTASTGTAGAAPPAKVSQAEP